MLLEDVEHKGDCPAGELTILAEYFGQQHSDELADRPEGHLGGSQGVLQQLVYALALLILKHSLPLYFGSQQLKQPIVEVLQLQTIPSDEDVETCQGMHLNLQVLAACEAVQDVLAQN